MKASHTILAIFICIIWGVNFVVAKAAVTHIPIFFFLGARLALASLIMAPFMHKPDLPFVDIFKISITLTVLHFGFMFGGLSMGIDSSVAVVIDQLRVPFVLILGYFLFGETIGRKGAFGIALALLGTFIITGAPTVSSNYLAMWMMVGGAAAWAFYNIQVKNIKNVKVLSFIGWVSLFGAPQLFIISAIFEHGQLESLQQSPQMAVLSLLYMAVFVTIVGHGSWFYLLQKHPVNKVVPYSLMIPVFGMIAGTIFLDEILTWQIIVGALFTITGVAAILVTRKAPELAKIERL